MTIDWEIIVIFHRNFSLSAQKLCLTSNLGIEMRKHWKSKQRTQRSKEWKMVKNVCVLVGVFVERYSVL